jgi:hypothetical protein
MQYLAGDVGRELQKQDAIHDVADLAHAPACSSPSPALVRSSSRAACSASTSASGVVADVRLRLATSVRSGPVRLA